jgi:hypothetical protein
MCNALIGAILLCLLPNHCQAEVAWRAKTAAAALDWTDVTYSHGIFVAVASTPYSGSSGSDLMYSANDGDSWVSISTGVETQQWSSVTHGGGYFFAVASSGTNRVMWCEEENYAATWNFAPAAADNSWQSVTYAVDVALFVAVASDGAGRVMTFFPAFWGATSLTMTAVTSQDNSAWQDIAWGEGKLVAVASSGTHRVTYSTDGFTWRQVTASGTNDWSSVTYGNGVWVAVASAVSSGTGVMYSSDAVTWAVTAALPVSRSLLGVTYGGGIFVAVGCCDSPGAMESTDGNSWTSSGAVQTAGSNGWMGVAYGNAKFVAVTRDGVMVGSIQSGSGSGSGSGSVAAGSQSG